MEPKKTLQHFVLGNTFEVMDNIIMTLANHYVHNPEFAKSLRSYVSTIVQVCLNLIFIQFNK